MSELTADVVVADRFRLIRPLGQGGMGAVWLAQHIALDVPCAIKFIHEEAARSAESRARFEREARTAAQLRSPHVVQILDHGVWEGKPYIAMEHLEGEDLAQRLRRRGTLPPREVLAIASQIGRALTKAQAANLVHRDLKPNNVFLVQDDEREIVKVLDFGVAKVQETSLDDKTKTGALLGTPPYMSPEQARGKTDIDHRSDLWALAVLIFKCVVGRLPFDSDNLGDLLMLIISDPPPVPSRLANVPPGFDAWWARAVERQPAERFQSARELTDALAAAFGVSVPESADVGARAPDVPPPASGPVASVKHVTAATPFTAVSIGLRSAEAPAISAPAPAVTTGPQAAPSSVPMGLQAAPSSVPMGLQAAPISVPMRAHDSASIGPLVQPTVASPGEPPRRSAPVAALVAGAITGAIALGALGLFVVFPKGPRPPAVTAASATATATANPTTTASALASPAPPAPAPPSASSSAPAPPASASGSRRAPPAAKRAVSPAPTARDEFGF